MSGAVDRPSERDGRLASRRVREGERARDGPAESTATCRASSSKWAKYRCEQEVTIQGDTGRRRYFRYFVRQLGHLV